MPEHKQFPVWKLALTWILRLVTGGLFIFSGFVKAVDPWGTIIKVGEYSSVLGLRILPALITLFVFALCAVEFVVGVFLLLGCYRKSCPIVAALIMCLMLPLSAWLWFVDPIPDCGCFGDALVISNQATFFKNIILCCTIAWLIIYNIKAACLIIPAFQWLAVVSSGLFIVLIELCGYFYQPLIDFRPYPDGSPLFSDQENDIPDRDLYVFTLDDDEDVTDSLANLKGDALWIMIPDVVDVSPATTWKLNSLYEWSQNNDIFMGALVSGSQEEIDNWEDLSMAEYPVFLADDTAIEEVVRGNPGIVYTVGNKVAWKAALGAVDVDDFISPEASRQPAAYGIDKEKLLWNLIFLYLIIEAFLVFISFTPRLARLLTRGGLASSKGIRRH